MKNKIIIILVILLGLGIFGLGSWFLFVKNKEPKTIYEKTSALLTPKMVEKVNLDTDEDGLRDWEETLWKTDVNNPDTDEDGHTDGKETQSGYDPLDPLSNPDTGKKSEKAPVYTKTASENSNLTQSFAQTISSHIKDPSQIDQIETENVFALLDSDTNQGLLAFVSGFYTKIPASEFKITSDNSPASINKYLLAVGDAIPEIPHKETEEDILEEAIQTENFKKIDDFIEHYKISAKNMKKVLVPSDFLEIHKREVELFIATQKVYENIKKIKDDPLRTILSLEENQKIREEMSKLINNFLKLAEKKLTQ